jgi:hypothetical protein
MGDPGVKDWTAREDRVLRRYYRLEGPDAIQARLPGRTRRAIICRVYRLGLEGRRWTAEEDRVIRLCYRADGAAYCRRYMPHRSLAAIMARARKLRVRRDPRRLGSGPGETDTMTAYATLERMGWLVRPRG